MDAHPNTPSPAVTATPPSTPVPARPAVLITWPRPVQIALGVLLAATFAALTGKVLLQALQAGPSTIPSQRINLNAATHAELLLLPGVGEALAERIVKARSANGGFKNVDELRRVSGIGPAKLERLRGWVYVGLHAPPAAVREPSLPLLVEPSSRSGTKSKKSTNLHEPIDINSADAARLMLIPGIGPKLSQRIIDARAGKPFETVADLRRVRGIGPKILEKIQPFVTVAKTAPKTEIAEASQ
jgi:competence protein ComEA